MVEEEAIESSLGRGRGSVRCWNLEQMSGFKGYKGGELVSYSLPPPRPGGHSARRLLLTSLLSSLLPCLESMTSAGVFLFPFPRREVSVGLDCLLFSPLPKPWLGSSIDSAF